MTGTNMSALTLNSSSVTSGNSVVVLGGTAQSISGTVTAGYTWSTWSKTSGTATFGAAGTLSTTVTVSAASTINAAAVASSYTISCALNGGTGGCSSVTSATVNENVTIPKPTKSFVVTLDSNSTGATLSSSTASKAQTFSGWTSASGLNTSTAKYGSSASNVTTSWSNASTKVGADYATTYFKNLRMDSGTVNLTANWTAVDVTLPTITKTGYTCGFSNDQNATSITYGSGSSYTPSTTTGGVTLYAVCVAKKFKVTYRSDGGYIRPASDNSNVLASYSGYLNAGTGHSTNSTLTTWTDISGKLHKGSVIDGTWGNDYLSFNGTSTSVDFGFSFGSSSRMTYMVTFSVPEVTSTTNYRRIVGNWNNGGGGLFISSDGYIFGSFCIGTSDTCSWIQVSSSSKVTANTIYTVALVYNGSNVILYVDGSAVDTVTASGNIKPPTSDTHMFAGCNPLGSSCTSLYFKGNIYELVVLDKALTASKILESSYKTVTYDSVYGTMPSPTRLGYTFKGWYTAGSGGTKIQSTTSYNINGNQTLYAQWTPIINNGHYLVVPTASPSFALHVVGASTTSGAAVHLYTSNNSDPRTKAEVIDLKNGGDGYITLLNHHSQKAISTSGLDDNADVVIHSENKQDCNQRWLPVTTTTSGGADGYYLKLSCYITDPYYGDELALSAGNYTDNSSVYTVDFRGQDFQVWSFTPVTTYNTYTYSIAYDKNTGSGTMNNQSASWNNSVTLSTNTFTKTNYAFDGWNTSSNGSGIAYANKGKYAGLTNVNGGTVTLYAQWKQVRWTMYPKTPVQCRSGPGTSYSVTKTYSCGTAITVTDKSNSSWYKTSDNCYSSSTFLQNSSTPCS